MNYEYSQYTSFETSSSLVPWQAHLCPLQHAGVVIPRLFPLARLGLLPLHFAHFLRRGAENHDGHTVLQACIFYCRSICRGCRCEEYSLCRLGEELLIRGGHGREVVDLLPERGDQCRRWQGKGVLLRAMCEGKGHHDCHDGEWRRRQDARWRQDSARPILHGKGN